MDSMIAAAARALVAGDALGALKRIALRDDPPALALRGIAMAQLGEHPRARELLRRAARGFGVHEELARARAHRRFSARAAQRRRSQSPGLLHQEQSENLGAGPHCRQAAVHHGNGAALP